MVFPQSPEPDLLAPWRYALVHHFYQKALKRDKTSYVDLVLVGSGTHYALHKILNKLPEVYGEGRIYFSEIAEDIRKAAHELDRKIVEKGQDKKTSLRSRMFSTFFEGLVLGTSGESPLRGFTPDELYDLLVDYPEAFSTAGTPTELCMPAVHMLATQGRRQLFGIPEELDDSSFHNWKNLHALADTAGVSRSEAENFAGFTANGRNAEIAESIRKELARITTAPVAFPSEMLVHVPKFCALSFDRSHGGVLLVNGRDAIPPRLSGLSTQPGLFSNSGQEFFIGIADVSAQKPTWPPEVADRILLRKHTSFIPGIYATIPPREDAASGAAEAIVGLLAAVPNSTVGVRKLDSVGFPPLDSVGVLAQLPQRYRARCIAMPRVVESIGFGVGTVTALHQRVAQTKDLARNAGRGIRRKR